MERDSESVADDWSKNETVKQLLHDHLDETDYRIYKALNEDGRMSDTELGERVGLSRTAARRRRRKLEEDGIIDVLGVLVFQQANFSYADVFVTLDANISSEELDSFLEEVRREEPIYEIEEYMGQYDLMLRVWHASLADIKTYLRSQLQNHDAIASYETIPIAKTHKAWHKTMAHSE